MGDERTNPRMDPALGLCSICRFVKRQDTRRGAVFYRCGRSEEDESYRQYPPMPVIECRGFEAVAD